MHEKSSARTHKRGCLGASGVAMKVLIIKMSSLGDVIHSLPAVTDAAKALKNVHFDWVVESAFQEIPKWHPAVGRVIGIDMRRWRKNIMQALQQGEIKRFIKQLRTSQYDLVLDAQGLIKSSSVAFLAKGHRVGLDKHSARESIASLFYQTKIAASKNQHAVEKLRQLFARALGYSYQASALSYGIDEGCLKAVTVPNEYVMFLHGTTWSTKHWPEQYWYDLAALLSEQGKQVMLTWGNEREKQRAEKIRTFCEQRALTLLPIILPKLSLGEITYVIAKAQAVVAVDTGLGHIAAMMNVPTVSLYGPTFPGFTGAYGNHQRHLSVSKDCHPCFEKQCPIAKENMLYPPCFESLPPATVFEIVKQIMQQEPQYG